MELLSEVIINVTSRNSCGGLITKFLTGELEEDFVRSDRDKFSAWGFIKVTCQKCDVNLTKVHVLLEM